MKGSYLKELNKMPPIMCRLLARHGRQGKRPRIKTIGEISKDSGIPIGIVRIIALKDCWDDVQMKHVDAFMKGCGIERGNMARHRKFLQREFKRDLPLDYINTLRARQRRVLSKWMSKSTKFSPTQEI